MTQSFTFPGDGRSISRNVASLNILFHDVIKEKDILILGKVSTQGLDDTMSIAEAQYSVNFSKSNKKFSLTWHYNASSRFFIC